MGVTQTECELLRSAAPKGAVMECQLSAASQGLSGLFVGKWRERGCVCRDVNSQEAQRETFLFIVTAYGMRKSSAHTHTQAHSSAASLQNYMRGIHASVNRHFETVTVPHVEKFLL